MSNTRKTDQLDIFRPEKFMSHPKVSGINIGLNVVVRNGRSRNEKERASLIWLHNYARLRGVTADGLSEEIQIDRNDITHALTNPDYNLDPFVATVTDVRTNFDRTRRRLYPTTGCKLIHKVVRFAADKSNPCEIIGKWRSGKTWPAWEAFLDNMHRALWFLCPSGNDTRDFFSEFARHASIGVGTIYKPGQLRPKLLSLFGKNAIELLITDEAQRLWPTTNSRNGTMAYPRRLEFERDIYDMFIPAQVGIVNLCTPQHSEMMSKALAKHELWAPGQWEGRAQGWAIPETMTDEELEGVARWHGPDLADNATGPLLDFAKSSEGYIGSMVKAIERAREFYAEGKTIRRADVVGAIKSIQEAAKAK